MDPTEDMIDLDLGEEPTDPRFRNGGRPRRETGPTKQIPRETMAESRAAAEHEAAETARREKLQAELAARAAEDKMRQERIAAARAEAEAQVVESRYEPVPMTPAADVKVTVAQLRPGNIIAGATAADCGVQIAWRGLGEKTVGALRDIRTIAGCPASWDPVTKAPDTHATRAVDALKRAGYQVQHLERDDESDYDERWHVGSAGSSRPGEPFGVTKLTVTLTGGELEFEYADEVGEDLAQDVRAEFSRRVAAEIFNASDVTGWLSKILRTQLGAVRLGPGYYVPVENKAAAEALCHALASSGWGRDWMLPALPIMTSEQLSEGIFRGLEVELAAVEKSLAKKREEAKKKGKSEIGVRAAAGSWREFAEVADRAKAYALLLGEAKVAPIRERIALAMGSVEPLIDDVSMRFAALDL